MPPTLIENTMQFRIIYQLQGNLFHLDFEADDWGAAYTTVRQLLPFNVITRTIYERRGTESVKRKNGNYFTVVEILK